MKFLEHYIQELQSICKNYKVKSLYAFGSVLTDNFNEKSDIDLIVDFEKFDIKDYANNYYDLKFSLEKIFKRSVDLLEEQAIKNPYFKQHINLQKKLVYG